MTKEREVLAEGPNQPFRGVQGVRVKNRGPEEQSVRDSGNQNFDQNKNIQQPKVWTTSPNAYRSVLGDSPLYPAVLQAASGGFRRQFTYLNILHPKTA
jgi:hypothetical protein